MRASIRACLVLAVSVVPGVAAATTLVHMNLNDLAGRSERIFRGTVVAIDTGIVRAGGGSLPTVIYRVRVGETFKGEFPAAKEGSEPVIEIHMLGTKDGNPRQAGRMLSILSDVPRLEKDREYVLFTTRPSTVGLSTTVGLGQGAFTIQGVGKRETVVNAFGNAGLNRGLRDSRLPSGGPMTYELFAEAVRAAVGE